MDDQSDQRTFRVQDLCEDRFTAKVSGITHLSTGFRIEGGLVEDDLAFLSRVDPIDLFAVSDDCNHRRLQLEALVAQEYCPPRLRNAMEGFCDPWDISKRFQVRSRHLALAFQLRLEPVPIASD